MACLVSTLAATTPRMAHADEVTPTGKGIAGTALLGGELVVFAEAIFGVRKTTWYLVGAGAGLVGGGVGGYFIEQAVDDGRVPAYLLAGGLALVIPAIVVTLDATRYRAEENLREDRPMDTMPPSDPGKPGGSSVIGAEPPPAKPPAEPPAATQPPPGTPPQAAPPAGGGTGGGQGPRSLLDVHHGSLRMGLPVPEVRPMLGATERKAFGVQNQGSEVRFPVVHVTF